MSSSAVVCSDIGYVEARAALAAAHRSRRLTAAGQGDARTSLDSLWALLEVIPATNRLLRGPRTSPNLPPRGYDAAHVTAALTVPVETLATSDTTLCDATADQGIHVSTRPDPHHPVVPPVLSATEGRMWPDCQFAQIAARARRTDSSRRAAIVSASRSGRPSRCRLGNHSPRSIGEVSAATRSQ